MFKEFENLLLDTGQFTQYPTSSDKAFLMLTLYLLMFSGCSNYLDIRPLSDDVFR